MEKRLAMMIGWMNRWMYGWKAMMNKLMNMWMNGRKAMMNKWMNRWMTDRRKSSFCSDLLQDKELNRTP